MRIDAKENHLRIVRAARDVVGWAGNTAISVKEIAAQAGVGMATIYRHFDTKQQIIDEVSRVRWSHMVALSGRREEEELAVQHVLRILERYTRMTTSDHRFILGAQLELGTTPVEDLRTLFEPHFAESWVDAQNAGHIRTVAHPRDAIDMAGVIRDKARRLPMFRMLAEGICTPEVDVSAFIAQVSAQQWK